MGLPMFLVSVSASSAARARMASATLNRIVPRSRCIILRQGPSSNAARAAPTAARTSSRPASGTVPSTDRSVGLTTYRVVTAARLDPRPPIHILDLGACAHARM